MSDINDLLNDLKSSQKAYSSKKSNLLNNLGESAANKVKSHTPVDSGKLRESIRHRVKDNKVEIYSDVDYAEAVDQGHVTGSRFVAGQHFFERGLMEAENASDAIVERFFDNLDV